MQTTEQLVTELSPIVYTQTIRQLDIDPRTDMSHSNNCSHLTLSLYGLLGQRGVESRRELHQNAEGFWHYVIVHAPVDSVPSETDTITDLNPWQYITTNGHIGFLHGQRNAVEEILGKTDSPDWFISLRGLATITKAHSLKLTPFSK